MTGRARQACRRMLSTCRTRVFTTDGSSSFRGRQLCRPDKKRSAKPFRGHSTHIHNAKHSGEKPNLETTHQAPLSRCNNPRKAYCPAEDWCFTQAAMPCLGPGLSSSIQRERWHERTIANVLCSCTDGDLERMSKKVMRTSSNLNGQVPGRFKCRTAPRFVRRLVKRNLMTTKRGRRNAPTRYHQKCRR